MTKIQKIIDQLQEKYNLVIFDFQAPEYIENFLVSAVAAIVLIRIFLHVTGYIQLSPGNLHIAHMLWGGLLMLVAIFFLLGSLNKEAKKFASVVGGLGFGTFIDELGKFITKDNNYFFQPTFALLYLLFVCLFFTYRFAANRLRPSAKDFTINALEVLKEVFFYDLQKYEKQKFLNYLQWSRIDEKEKQALKKLVQNASVEHPGEQALLTKIKNSVTDIYFKFVKQSWFAYLVLFLFIVHALSNLFVTIPRFQQWQLGFWNVGALVSAFLVGVFVLQGLRVFFKSRLSAYQRFKEAVLISILLSNFFAFYKNPFWAVFSLFFNITLYSAIQFLIEQESAAPS